MYKNTLLSVLVLNIKSLIRNFKNWNFPPIYSPFNIMAVMRNEIYQLSFFVMETAKIQIRH